MLSYVECNDVVIFSDIQVKIMSKQCNNVFVAYFVLVFKFSF